MAYGLRVYLSNVPSKLRACAHVQILLNLRAQK